MAGLLKMKVYMGMLLSLLAQKNLVQAIPCADGVCAASSGQQTYGGSVVQKRTQTGTIEIEEPDPVQGSPRSISAAQGLTQADADVIAEDKVAWGRRRRDRRRRTRRRRTRRRRARRRRARRRRDRRRRQAPVPRRRRVRRRRCASNGVGLPTCSNRLLKSGRKWFDNEGHNCAWYEANHVAHCSWAIKDANKEMHSKQACCVCGGGVRRTGVVSLKGTGSKECNPANHITDACTCQAAASVLGKTYAYAFSSNDWVPNCAQHGNAVYFNEKEDANSWTFWDHGSICWGTHTR